MKRIVISLFALSLLGTLSPVVTAQDNKGESVKQEAKGTGKAAGNFGKNTGKFALAGTKKGLSKAGNALGKAANKIDKGDNKGKATTPAKNTHVKQD